ncbi:hypothetical protein BH11ACT2_BH11ACT2_18190 [soil metagenome]
MADDIDPRFDPAFQRGFEATVGTTRRRPPVGTPSVVPAQETVAKPTAPIVAPRAVVDDESFVDHPIATALDPEPEARRFNPFLVALVLIGVVLIAAGIAGSMFANSVFQTDLTSTVSYVTVLLVISGSAVSIGVGVATLIGILFLAALRYRRG